LNKGKAEPKTVPFPLRLSRIQTPLDPYTKATAMKHGALKARFFERWASIGVSALKMDMSSELLVDPILGFSLSHRLAFSRETDTLDTRGYARE